MKYYTEFNAFAYKYKIAAAGDKKTAECMDIIAFDIETTSVFYDKNECIAEMYDFTRTSDYYQQLEKTALCWFWTVSINGECYYGRDLHTFPAFLSTIAYYAAAPVTVWVHNLPFEFQFIQRQFTWRKIRAREKRKPFYAETDNGIIFRCTYAMTNISLASVANDYKLPVKKLVGDLDYYTMRTPASVVTDAEMQYMQNDVLIIDEYIKMVSADYDRFSDIPYTQTGFVRKAVRAEQGDKLNRINARKNEKDIGIFQMLNRCFAGGYTHANVYNCNRIIDDVVSWDFSSSYPYVMLSEKFPCERFEHGYPSDLIAAQTSVYWQNKSYMVDVTFYDYECVTKNTFISASKCLYMENGEYDNGRVLSADIMRVVLTDVDLTYFLKTASFSSYKINDGACARKTYLPRALYEYILRLYQDKTQLKNVPSEYSRYLTQKQRLNSIYGMCVTNNIKPEILYDNGVWYDDEFTYTDMQKKLIDNIKFGFLNYAWGVWVTAYARRNLWSAIVPLDDYIIYCDTDSIKTFNVSAVQSVVDDYNADASEKLRAAAAYFDAEFDYAPCDIKGVPHPLGAFDFDGHYKQFKTLGAKKYAYIADDDSMHITVSGVPKRYSKYLKSLDEFRDGLVFHPLPPSVTGGADISKKISHYCDEPVSLYFPAATGDGIFECTTSVCLQPTSYTLDMQTVYKSLCEKMMGK